MKPTVIFVDGIPMWNDDRGGVHLPTQMRSHLSAKHLPIDPIEVRQLGDSFDFGGVYHPAGSYVRLVGGKAVEAFSAAEFAAQWEVTGTK